MRIKILGSGQEVGRSSLIIEGRESVMLDCGVKIEPPPPTYPKPEKIKAAVISHAHLDHIGGTPMLFRKGNPKVFMNDITLELSNMLIKDSIKVAKKEGYGTPFGKKELKKMIKSTKLVRYNERFKIGDANYSLWPSGHIPGSSGILAEGDKRVFYTSDTQTTDSHLLKRCHVPQNVDTLVIESTYGYKNHPPRERLEADLIEAVSEAVANQESVLFPVFAVGRAQEIVMILEKFAGKIAMDGMARQASDIIKNYSFYLRDSKKYKELMSKVFYIRKSEDRAKALKNCQIIISSAGMLGGGPAIHYLREISRRRGSKVLFSGFLVEDTPGRNLLETKIFKNAEEEFHVHCELRQFELSAHTDQRGLFEIIKRTNPKKVVCVHGDNCKEFAKLVEEHFGIEAVAPKNGETVKA